MSGENADKNQLKACYSWKWESRPGWGGFNVGSGGRFLIAFTLYLPSQPAKIVINMQLQCNREPPGSFLFDNPAKKVR